MSKGKRMYTPVKKLEEGIIRLKTEWKTWKEISKILLLPNEVTVKNALYRNNRRQKEIPKEIKHRGRRRKTPPTPQRELELRVQSFLLERTSSQLSKIFMTQSTAFSSSTCHSL